MLFSYTPYCMYVREIAESPEKDRDDNKPSLNNNSK